MAKAGGEVVAGNLELCRTFQAIESHAAADSSVALLEANHYAVLHCLHLLAAGARDYEGRCSAEESVLVSATVSPGTRPGRLRVSTAPFAGAASPSGILALIRGQRGDRFLDGRHDAVQSFRLARVANASLGACRVYRASFEVPAHMLRGRLKVQHRVLPEIRSWLRLLLLAVMLGTLRRLCGLVLDYTQTRVTFGKAICHHQAVSLQLADAAMNLEMARLLCENACAASCREPQRNTDTRLVWEYLNPLLLETALAQIQLMGGHGYLHSQPAQSALTALKFLTRLGNAQEASGGLDACA